MKVIVIQIIIGPLATVPKGSLLGKCRRGLIQFWSKWATALPPDTPKKALCNTFSSGWTFLRYPKLSLRGLDDLEIGVKAKII